MKSSTIMLGLVLLLGLSLAVTNSDQTEKVKLYYGTIGSEDYIWGTAPAGNPADAWQLHSNMPQALMDNCAAANDSHAYVISGYNTSHPRFLFRHPIGSTTWQTLAQPPQEISNGGCAIIGDTLYYCSGYTYETGTTVDTLWKYSISGNTWTSAPGPFTGTTYNWQPLILACQGKLYYISGCNQPGATNPSREVYAYTPGAGWTRVADMNQGAVFMAGWVYHDTIWVAGGVVNNPPGITRTEFYDPVADTWVIDNTVFPQLPYGVWGHSGGIVGNTAFIAGGVDAAGQLTDSVAYFDYTSRSWSVAEPIYLRVYRGAGAGNRDGKAVVYGGSTGGFTPTTVCQYEVFSTGNETDVGVAQIVTPPPIVTPGLYTPRARIKNFGTQPQSNIPIDCWIDSAGTRVYEENVTYPGPLEPGATADVDFSPQWRAVGGSYDVTMFTYLDGDQLRSNDTMRSTTRVMQYTIDWFQSDTIRPDRVSRTAVCTDASGNVHVICGNCYNHTTHPYDQIYDTVANTWSQGLQHPGGGVHNHDAVRIGDVIWCGGGSLGSSGYYNNMTKLDLGASTWTAAAAMPQSNLLYYSLEEYADSGWVFCFGGCPSGGSTIANAYKYNTTTNSWTPIANMPGPRRNPMTARVGDTIYVIGGMEANDYTSTRGTVWKYSVLGNTWTVAPDTMPDALGWGKAVTYDFAGFGTYIYVMGGYRRGTVVNACWRYDPIGHTWNADRALLTATRSHGADIAGNYIWVGGGWNSSNGILPNVQKGIIAIVGVEEGKPSINWVSGFERITPTVVCDLARISYYVPAKGNVNLSVYDASGKLVRTLVSGVSEPGTKTVTWDRKDKTGTRVASGTYFYRLTVDGKSVSAKAIVLQ
ncbi:MAG: kelch repeat-containing protein [candidate division WOR-3 bacterium]